MAFSGSVATIKDYQMVKQLKEIPNLNIRCVYTQSGRFFKLSSARKAELFNLGLEIDSEAEEKKLFKRLGIEVSESTLDYFGYIRHCSKKIRMSLAFS